MLVYFDIVAEVSECPLILRKLAEAEFLVVVVAASAGMLVYFDIVAEVEVSERPLILRKLAEAEFLIGALGEVAGVQMTIHTKLAEVEFLVDALGEVAGWYAIFLRKTEEVELNGLDKAAVEQFLVLWRCFQKAEQEEKTGGFVDCEHEAVDCNCLWSCWVVLQQQPLNQAPDDVDVADYFE